jgi:hypothetical protein
MKIAKRKKNSSTHQCVQFQIFYLSTSCTIDATRQPCILCQQINRIGYRIRHGKRRSEHPPPPHPCATDSGMLAAKVEEGRNRRSGREAKQEDRLRRVLHYRGRITLWYKMVHALPPGRDLAYIAKTHTPPLHIWAFTHWPILAQTHGDSWLQPALVFQRPIQKSSLL